MAKIIRLDEALSNKIAAGEVVERPASIVKELIENAIDANSTSILIEAEEGGLSHIRIVDNGDGMDSDDVETAFFRHATSKIKNDRDLFHISTLGFRGEALPSIASVSYVTLLTSTGAEKGIELKLEGGTIVSKSAARARKGTEVVVTNLFYNTPARLKYVKTVHTEAGNISDVVNRLALAHPAIAFHYRHDGKDVLRTAGNGDVRQVASSIYGRQVAKQMIEISGRSLDYELEGWIAKPEVNRASRQYISIFINGRYIRNFALARAIQAGYHTLLPIGRYPIGVLSINMDPQLIDVNVHPAKLEVRLSKEEELSQLLTEVIQNAFKKETLIPEVDTRQRSSFEPTVKEEQLRLNLEQQQNEMVRTIEDDHSASTFQYNESVNHSFHEETDRQLEQTRDTKGNDSELEENMQESKLDRKENSASRVPTLYPIGQMHGTYIVAQNDTGMYLIDQHAAQERIKYEYFRDKVGQVTRHVQELMVPITFEYTVQEAHVISEHLDDLKAVGVFLEPFGHQSYVVKSHPSWFPKGYEEETIKEMIDYLLTYKSIDLAKLREEAAILMSCKAAIKANRHLRHDEMYALLESLRQSSDPFTCPHGRPIIVHFSTYSIEKMFKRIM
ncbi:DNA mismatch repair endonuclease MutL [Halalkalibacter hemicellulosilyticus]|uniref:DNA mismatch repair protein MutL n=1 Tax=Halalkalibacter hemicellulosilyticusJCM 9152 TaxID=1236971 RepID=W4QFG4_9BACI|nr:DNA mismatch repair endonuclease MutL [Halalkalibacter hemicellulosilyticus]GAE30840.1 DNA mismatch repair protein MutL [Halalkalibacter hemicellulosilyticusJCM 9152]